MRLFVKFGYAGWEYSGFQSGNGDSSVEDTILSVIRATGISGGLSSAARTDRGVSAISNVIAFNTDFTPEKSLGILNSSIEGMIFHSWAEVPETMNPRHCDYKVYRYIIPIEQVKDPGLLNNQLQRFKGTHDFSRFSRRDHRNPVRTIRSIEVKQHGDIISIDFTARSFLWNQIRSIMGFAMMQNMEGSDQDPFSSTERFPVVVDPHPLLLLNIEYQGIQFKSWIPRSKLRNFYRRMNQIRVRGLIADQFLSGVS